ncbi:MAG: lysine--tRNA ligase [Candidatus Thorarchaeota archaeon]|nr:MAG: lysine--tRNA ligase [Candidatus Thorarchaeota archaeon]
MTHEPPDDEYSIHWIRDVVDKVAERNVEEYRISSGKSVSGSIHLGFMRELVICDVIMRELRERGLKSCTLFIVDDFDPLRSLPGSSSLSLDEWAGIPYSDVPDEFGCCQSYGEHHANELIETFPEFGVDPEVIWHHKLYETPEMKQAVRTCLLNTDTIREILIEYVARDFNDEQQKEYIESIRSWYPATVVCPDCGRLQSGAKGEIVPNRVTNYDAEKDMVSFNCPACGHANTLPLDSIRVKLSWRVDWPAKWHVLDVTCEPAGKDHAVKGGSYDSGLEISRRVFGWEGPVKVPFEWVRIGGRDMSSSEGIVFIPKRWSAIAPPELYRFIMLKTDLNRAINIMPEKVPDMTDEFERLERTYYGIDAESAIDDELARLLYPLCLSGAVPEEFTPNIPFKFAIVMSQLESVIGSDMVMSRSEYAIQRQYSLESVSAESRRNIRRRLDRALKWVQEFGSNRDRVDVPDLVPSSIIETLTELDIRFLQGFLEKLRAEEMDDETLQSAVFGIARELGLKEKRAFVVLYRILISRKSGPRLAPFINMLGRDWVIRRITDALELVG